MTVFLNFIIPVFFVGAFGAGFYFLIKALTDRSAENHAHYSVGKQRAHYEKKVEMLRAICSFFVGVLLLLVFLFAPRPDPNVVADEPIVDAEVDGELPTAVVSPTATESNSGPAIIIITPTSEMVATATSQPMPAITETAVVPAANTAIPTPTIPPTPTQPTATVSSGVGVWLRAEPSTSSAQLEWLLEGTTVFVLNGTATGENLAWQEVQTQGGVVGWVAVPFIAYNQ